MIETAAFFALIREIWSRATCRVSWLNHFSSICWCLDKKGYTGRQGQDLDLVKATISQRQYWYQNHRKITYKKTNFLYVYPLLVLRPDLDSSQDSRKVGQGIFQKHPKIDVVIYRGGKDFFTLDCNNYMGKISGKIIWVQNTAVHVAVCTRVLNLVYIPRGTRVPSRYSECNRAQ